MLESWNNTSHRYDKRKWIFLSSDIYWTHFVCSFTLCEHNPLVIFALTSLSNHSQGLCVIFHNKKKHSYFIFHDEKEKYTNSKKNTCTNLRYRRKPQADDNFHQIWILSNQYILVWELLTRTFGIFRLLARHLFLRTHDAISSCLKLLVRKSREEISTSIKPDDKKSHHEVWACNPMDMKRWKFFSNFFRPYFPRLCFRSLHSEIWTAWMYALNGKLFFFRRKQKLK